MRKPASLGKIAETLGVEGLTPFHCEIIERNMRRQARLSESRIRRFDKLSEALSELTKDMSSTDRYTLGRFIGMKERMAFDAGIRIGLGMLNLKERE